MDERYFAWDEISEGLFLVSVTKAEEEQAKRRRKQIVAVPISEIYAPHAYLILYYREILSDSEKIRFRKNYLRKVTPDEPDIIILQDIKDLVLFLLLTSVSPQFINFFHLPIVDRFLRALIIYFQRFVQIWEDLIHERAATMKKAPNPLARGHRSGYANDLHTLRCVLGREYADLLLGCRYGPRYHHMITDTKRTATQSQGEKDLRIFEALISVAHRVVWIALQRKHFTLIEIELHRLLRTETYNTAQRQSGSQLIQDMLEDDIRILHGSETTMKTRKLLRNSPLPHELMYGDCDYRLLSLGVADIDIHHPKIAHLRNALLVDEEKLSRLGIEVGILGHNRSDYDIMLMPLKPEEPIEIALLDKKLLEMRRSIFEEEEVERLPEIMEVFPVKEIQEVSKKYKKILEKARIKWILREIRRRERKTTVSITATLD
ncbi:PPR36 phosphatase, partial [Acromyrmex charruanus]